MGSLFSTPSPEFLLCRLLDESCLARVKWYLIAVLICISLIAGGVEHQILPLQPWLSKDGPPRFHGLLWAEVWAAGLFTTPWVRGTCSTAESADLKRYSKSAPWIWLCECPHHTGACWKCRFAGPIPYRNLLCESVSNFKCHWLISPFSSLWLLLSWLRISLPCGRPGFDPWVRKIPRRRQRLPTPGFWPGECHRLCGPWGCEEPDTTEQLHSTSLFGKVVIPVPSDTSSTQMTLRWIFPDTLKHCLYWDNVKLRGPPAGYDSESRACDLKPARALWLPDSLKTLSLPSSFL